MRWFGFIFALFLMVGCTAVSTDSQPTAPPAPVVLDEETGLPLNPDPIPDGEFIVEGEVISVNVIPQDKPLFKIEADNGAVFQISPQPLADIYMADGKELTPLDFKNGSIARATVTQGDESGLGGEPVLSSNDFVIISLSE